MERPSIASFITSEMLELVTVDCTRVYVHRELFKAQSKLGGELWWEPFEGTTVKRFIEYLYQGDYSAPQPLEVQPITPASTVCDGDGGGESSPGAATAGEGALDYKGVFLAHAQLFILSRSQELSSLAQLCLSHLSTAIQKAGLKTTDPFFVENMNELLRYSYSHRYVAHSVAWGELQSLVSQFSVLNIARVMKVADSVELIRGGGKLAYDLMDGTAKRIVAAEQRVVAVEQMLSQESERMREKDTQLESLKAEKIMAIAALKLDLEKAQANLQVANVTLAEVRSKLRSREPPAIFQRRNDIAW